MLPRQLWGSMFERELVLERMGCLVQDRRLAGALLGGGHFRSWIIGRRRSLRSFAFAVIRTSGVAQRRIISCTVVWCHVDVT